MPVVIDHATSTTGFWSSVGSKLARAVRKPRNVPVVSDTSLKHDMAVAKGAWNRAADDIRNDQDNAAKHAQSADKVEQELHRIKSDFEARKYCTELPGEFERKIKAVVSSEEYKSLKVNNITSEAARTLKDLFTSDRHDVITQKFEDSHPPKAASQARM
tara:strand:- start:11 stop:487 length:477 start_codon:yes stop_codon:yes gene_type:complete